MSTLYKKICDQILGQIASGQRKVGDRLPPEADFANELGVSRSTLRLAYAELESTGVLRRRKRAGTEIIAAKPKPTFSMATTGLHELLSLGRNTDFHIDNICTVHEDTVELLHAYHSETNHWLEVRGSRKMPGEATPFCTNRVYVPARFAGIEPLIKNKNTAIFQIIEQTFGVSVSRVVQNSSAIKCPEPDALAMGLAPGAVALQINAALYVKGGELMELSVAIYDSKRFRLQSDVSIR